MALGLILSALAGLALGALVNWLAGVLPAMRTTAAVGETEETPSPPAAQKRPLVRVIVVEIILALFGAYLWGRYGGTAEFGVLLFYTALFTLIAVIDIEHRLVLNVVMFPAFVVALLEVIISPRITAMQGLSGYAVAQIVVMGFFLLGQVYLWIINARRDRPVTEVAFGFGDVTLATFCGLVVGYPDVFAMLVLTVLAGGLSALIYIVSRMLPSREYRAHTPLPYGPSIIVSAVVLLLWSDQILPWLLGG